MRPTGLFFITLSLLIFATVPTLAADAPDKKRTYEIKQSLKRERKNKRRKEKARELQKEMNTARKKKSAEKRAKKGITMDAETKEIALEKIHWLKTRSERSGNGMIAMSSDDYKHYINDGPRLHWTLVVFTARGGRYRCQQCHTVHPHLVKIGSSLNFTQEQPTFIAEIDIQRNGDIFQALALNHAPKFIMVPPTASKRTPKIKTLYKKLPDKYKMNVNNAVSEDDLKKFVVRHTGKDFELVEIIDYNGLAASAIMLGMVIAGLYYHGHKIAMLREYKLPYFTGAMVAFVWLMGGGMYNIIRNTQFSGQGSGLSALFHPGTGSQYIAGGLIAGVLNFGVGAAIILMNTWALKPYQKPKNAREPRTLVERIKALKPSPSLCLVGAVILWFNLVMVYTMKNPSYRLGFVQA